MKLHCDITLPASKSESNRALMIATYGDFSSVFQNLSDSRDTKVLSEALRSAQKGEHIIDIADCGTAARFMTTFLACHEGDWLLTGMERMKQRPLAPLVDALRKLGANIQYVENEGYLPLRIKGNPIKGGKASIDMSQSSQFASSLLLAAPMWPQGLELELFGKPSSLPYLDLTLNMMRRFSAQAERRGRKVVVKHKLYQSQQFAIEPDWTSASYWYEMAAFSEECEIKLRGLSNPLTGNGSSTVQGDAIIAEWMKSFGVCTTTTKDGIILTKTTFERKPLSFDFTCCPDLYPTIAATCAGLQIEAQFTGIDNLRVKESDRVKAMHMELSKLGKTPLRFCAHNDHRVVMALAPLALRCSSVTFDHPEVVSKSYPNFWDDIGFWFNI
ncbi:MAG: 3-phosphoshikimate 1-carboxyvinyltransferase [Bacteroidales bacterium]|nr:3-phosphoshikimate 1-carboxyvinyltransferase [Bacteroidales bacterium]